jgi:hypothetical protein
MENENIRVKPSNKKESSNDDESESDDSFVEGVYGNDNDVVIQYFEYYSKIMNQQNMLMDNVRTSCYHDAIFQNRYNN